jgi:hypothetical protein
MKTFNSYTVQEVAQACRRAAIEVLSTSPWKYEEDGEVQLDSDIHIQVGETYLGVTWCKSNTCHVDAGEINTTKEAIAAYHKFKEQQKEEG